MKNILHTRYFILFLLTVYAIEVYPIIKKKCLSDGIVNLEKTNQEKELHKQEPEEWSWGYAYRLTGKIVFASTVVVGATAIGVATGGIGLAAAVNAGSAIGPGLAATVKVGGVLGGLFGAGFGTDMAINEFDEEELSREARIASAIGKIILTTATLTPVVGAPSLVSAATDEGAKMLGFQVSTLASPTAKLGLFATGILTNKVRSNGKK